MEKSWNWGRQGGEGVDKDEGRFSWVVSRQHRGGGEERGGDSQHSQEQELGWDTKGTGQDGTPPDDYEPPLHAGGSAGPSCLTCCKMVELIDDGVEVRMKRAEPFRTLLRT